MEISRGYAYMRERKLLYEKILEQEAGSVYLFDSGKNCALPIGRGKEKVSRPCSKSRWMSFRRRAIPRLTQ